MQAKTTKERSFSVELQSKADLKNVNMTNGTHENVLIEGTIGELVQVGFTEGIIFEIMGKKGALRIDLEEHEITSNAITEKPAQGGD